MLEHPSKMKLVLLMLNLLGSLNAEVIKKASNNTNGKRCTFMKS